MARLRLSLDRDDVLQEDPELHSGFTPDRIVAVRRPWRWLVVAALGLVMAMAVHALVTEPGFGWSTVGSYLFAKPVLDGVAVTVELTTTAMLIGIALGLVLAVMRQSSNWILAQITVVYIWVFRGMPTLVQVIFWFNLAALFPQLSFGIPFGPRFVTGSANSFITPLVAANLGLGLSEGAYMAEIIRGGILGIDTGQSEAAAALGMSRGQILRNVIIPQAMRIIIPPTGNEVIGMLKYTSLASVVSVSELLDQVQTIYSRTFQPVPLLIVASIWYLVMTTILTIGQRYLERRFGRGRPGRSSQRRSLVGWRGIVAPAAR